MTRPVDLFVGRLCGAGLLAWMAWIHLHLWSAGYRHLHTVSELFLVDFVLGVAAALLVVFTPAARLAQVTLAGSAVVAATLAALAVSIHWGLFRFRESFRAPFVQQSVGVEAAALVVLTAVAWRAYRTTGSTISR